MLCGTVSQCASKLLYDSGASGDRRSRRGALIAFCRTMRPWRMASRQARSCCGGANSLSVLGADWLPGVHLQQQQTLRFLDGPLGSLLTHVGRLQKPCQVPPKHLWRDRCRRCLLEHLSRCVGLPAPCRAAWPCQRHCEALLKHSPSFGNTPFCDSRSNAERCGG